MRLLLEFADTVTNVGVPLGGSARRAGDGQLGRAFLVWRKAAKPGTTRPPPPASKIASAFVTVFADSST